MAFTTTFRSLRRVGRKVVLPSDKIKEIVKSQIPLINGGIIDLGAGTQYWSNWLRDAYQTRVYAVDSYYKEKQNCEMPQYTDYFKCIEEIDAKALWCCDVLHHLDIEFKNRVIDSIEDVGYEWIIIKDIDCRRKFGNFMNRVHDRIINHERIGDIDPKKLESELQNIDYEVKFYYLPKLWYPHFLLIAHKKKCCF